jgi:hypothetical protein
MDFKVGQSVAQMESMNHHYNQNHHFNDVEEEFNCSSHEESNYSEGDLQFAEPHHPMNVVHDSSGMLFLFLFLQFSHLLGNLSNGSDISISSHSDDTNDPHMLADSHSYYKNSSGMNVNKNEQNALRKLLPPSLARRNKSFEWCHQCKQRSERCDCNFFNFFSFLIFSHKF